MCKFKSIEEKQPRNKEEVIVYSVQEGVKMAKYDSYANDFTSLMAEDIETFYEGDKEYSSQDRVWAVAYWMPKPSLNLTDSAP